MTSTKDESAFLAYILTNKARSPLIPGTCSSPGTHNTIRSTEADRQGWMGMLVASLLPGQMAQLLRGEDASWRGVTTLQRAQSSREQKCWQLLMHLPERKETILPRKVCVCVCVNFPQSVVQEGWLRSKTRVKHRWKIQGYESTLQHNTMHPLSNDKVPVLKTPPLSGSDTAVQATSPRLSVDAVSQTSTDIHPLISLSEVFHSQSWIAGPKAGGQITF